MLIDNDDYEYEYEFRKPMFEVDEEHHYAYYGDIKKIFKFFQVIYKFVKKTRQKTNPCHRYQYRLSKESSSPLRPRYI